MHFPYALPEPDLQGGTKVLFSEIFDTLVHPAFLEEQDYNLFRTMAIASDDPPRFGKGEDANYYFQRAIEDLQELFGYCPQSIRGDLIQRVIRAASRFSLAHADELEKIEAELSKRKLLTHITDVGNVARVKSPMANLLERLNEATSQRGMKTKLAKIMGVLLANVSQWLSGEREPGGETTLQLLHWVEQQERQPNTLGSATNTTRGKVTRRKVVNENKPSSNHNKP